MDVVRNRADLESFSGCSGNIMLPRFIVIFPISVFYFIVGTSVIPEMGQVFVIRYKDKIIGGSVCLFSQDTAYLLFSAGMRKSYPLLYPGILAVWDAMVYAREQGFRHFEFIEAGVPFKRYAYRDFILRFGGKQLSTRRWFRIKWKWLNRLLIHLYV